MKLSKLMEYAAINGASDIHISIGLPPILRKDGRLINIEEGKLDSNDTKNLIQQALDEQQLQSIKEKGEVDTVISIPEVGRFRINAYNQRDGYAMAIRIIPLRAPTMEELGLPKILKDISKLPRGLILVTGPAGSGKTTTLASIIRFISEEKKCHILTLEDPIEYLHKHHRSMVNQREIGTNTIGFTSALRSALRQDPDVILIGEMRDLETMSIALTAAETGHLIFSTLHTLSAAETIDRIIDVFPFHRQQQIRVQLASVIQAIISQQLLPRIDDGMVAAFELMIANPAIKNLIREGKTYQIDTAIQTGRKQGMLTMDQSLSELCNNGIISKKMALSQAADPDTIKKYLL